MASLKDRLVAASTIEETAELAKSMVFEKKDLISTKIPILNIALTGTVDGGLPPGILQIAGPSKHFKSKFALVIIDEFLEKHKDGVVLFYDSEFGTPESYFDENTQDRIVHTPITNIEQLKHDMMVQLDGITKEDNILILVDSLGNLASKKEVEDSIKSDSQPTDMTRAKSVKSLFRMITPLINLKRIPCIVVNHTYDSLELYSKKVVASGTGSIYNSNIIWIINSKAQNKDSDKELLGFNFTIRIEKSRFIKEGLSFPITVDFKDGIDQWSGLFDIAVENNFIKKKNAITYVYDGKEFPRKNVARNAEFWNDFLKKSGFAEWVEKEYKYHG